MSSQRRLRLMVIVLLVMGMVLSACERPFQADTGVDPLSGSGDQTVVEPTTDAAAPAEATVEESDETVAEEPAEGESPRPEDGAESAEGEEQAATEEEAPAEEPAATEEEAPAEEPVVTEEEAPAEEPAVTEEEAPAEEAQEPAEEAAPEPTAEPTPEPTTAPTTTDPQTGQQIHVVKAGENLFRIGLLYGVSWVAIADANGITEPTRVLIGTELVIPSSDSSAGDATADPTPTPTDDNTYTVRPGDTLFEISQDIGVDWRLIAEANGIINPNNVVAGTVLKIPTGDEPGVTPEFTHLVENGETLFLISLNYGVTWNAIAEANEIEAPYIIYPGEELVIPSNTGD